jgi:tetratricopeptide (TPR) repeat protein
MGAVYAAEDRLNNATVALKIVNVGADGLGFNSRSDFREAEHALANEFQVLAGLRHPHIISVLDYGFHQPDHGSVQPFFTMELVPDADTITAHSTTADTATRFKHLFQTLQALSYLHERGILHRDLKPGNVLVNVQGAKVLDFGLALQVKRPTNTDDAAIGGTLGYIAPELLSGNAASVQSDLYAFGLLAVEVLSGKFPFNLQAAPIQLINQIMFDNIDFVALDIPLAIAQVLGKLTAKKPGERYPSARAALHALAAAADQDPPRESAAIRDSILQSARFIGRETEFATLTNSFDDMLTGKGTAWLIGGESGVGKTRLMNELRTYALVQGAMVLRGEATQSGDATYQLWREPVRRLLLTVEVSDFEAGVLANYIPDVSRILQREVPPVRPLEDADAEHRRTSATIVQLFERVGVPMLLLLEDLHWARVETLGSLMGAVHTLPLMIVANYRHDEAPQIAEQLNTMQHMTLRRLDENETAALTISMVGDAANNPGLLALIQEETEGNVFFLVETVRALAEEAGSVAQIGRESLPARVFAGGIQQIVQRRLDRVPAADRPLLRVAAVVGREVSVEVLEKVIALFPQYKPEIDLQHWLLVANHAAVLEAREQGWRFAHDRLREHLLDSLQSQDEVYQHAALALEALYPDLPDDDARVGLLAELWQQAGEHERELNYRTRRGIAMRDIGINRAAYDELNRALELLNALNRTPTFQLLQYAANAAGPLGFHTVQQTRAEEALALANNDAERAGAYSLLTLAHTHADNAEQAAEAAAKSVDYAERAGDLVSRLNAYEARLNWHFRSMRYHKALADGEIALALARELNDDFRINVALSSLSKMHYHLNNLDEALRLALQTLDYFELIGAWAEIVDVYNNLGIVYGRQKQYDKSLAYYRMAVERYRQLGNEYQTGIVYLNMGVSTKNTGDYQRSLEYYARAEDIFRRHNTNFGIAIIQLNRALALLLLERYEDAIRENLKAVELGMKLEAYGIVAHAAVGMARIAAAVGEYETASRLVNALLHSDIEEAHARNEAAEFRDEALAPHLDAALLAHQTPPAEPLTVDDVVTVVQAGIPGYAVDTGG